MCAAEQCDLNGSKSRHGSTTVDHKGLAGGQREEIDAASRRFDCHRQGGGLSDI
jgi:hypothetical protein